MRLLAAAVVPWLLGAGGEAVARTGLDHAAAVSQENGLERRDAPVADAAQRGDMDAVRRLLREGTDVNAPQGDGMTALHWAAERGDKDLCEVLLYAGARVDAGTRIGHYTPLHLAARAASEAVVEMLLKAGSDPNVRTTNSGVMPLHLAAAAGDPQVLRALLGGGADVDGTEGAWGQTPLIFAAANNRAAAVQALLEAGADPAITARSVDVAEQEKADAAAERRLGEFLAAFKEKEGGGPGWQPTPSQVQAAIDASREIQRKWPDVPDPADDGRAEDEGNEAADTTAAEEASDDDPVQVGMPVEADEPSEEEPRPMSYAQMVGAWGGLTPLLHAVRQGHADAALALLEGGADIDQPSAGDGTTPLLMAAVNGQFDLAMSLLDRGADPNLTSLAGTAPLFAVLERQWAPRASYAHPTEHLRQHTTHLELLEALLEAGADPNVRLKSHLWYMEYTFGVLRGSGINLQGATPFWRAAYALDVDAMRLLKDHGADPDIATTKPPQRRRRPPAQEAEEPKEEKAEADGAAGGSEDEEAGGGEEEAPPPAEDAYGLQDDEDDPSGVPPVPVGGPSIYPIHAASGVGYGQSFAGNAHRHVPGNWMAAVKFLVEECGADVNVRDANAYTALHHAASRGDNELVLYLVDRGADVTVVSRRGQTTADMANGPIQRLQPFPATAALLEELGSKNNHECLSC